MIVMYHGVTRKNQAHINKRHVTVENFDGQIAVFKKNYEIVAVSEFFDNLVKSSKPKICLTFDDGYKNNLDSALPVLRKHNASAAIYITGLAEMHYPIIWADYLDLTERHSTGRKINVLGHSFINVSGSFISESSGQSLREVIRYLSPGYEFKVALIEALGWDLKAFDKVADREVWELVTGQEIKQLASEKLITIGSHGYYHNNLGSLDAEEAKDEMIKSVQYLQQLAGKPIQTIAYPDGSYNAEVKQAAKDLGMIYQLAAEGFRDEKDLTDTIIRNRKGIYNCGRPHTQLFDIYN